MEYEIPDVPNDLNFKIISELSSNGLVNKICILSFIRIF